MLEPGFILQVVTFVTLVLLFNHLELRVPGFKVSRRRDLALNAAAMALVVFGGEYAKLFIRAIYHFINLDIVMLQNRFSLLPGAAKIPLAILATDFSLYWVHRAIHHPLLWRTHMFHHSIPEIWWLAGSRTSFLHLVLFAVPQVFIGNLLFRLSPLQIGIALSISIFVNLWIHTNLRVDLGPFEPFFVTPNYHRIHHGGQGLSSRNMGFILTAWDRLFGTYLSPREQGMDFPIVPVPLEKQLWRMMLGI
jgi:sterol desaturase/sphingolipid hydroxylase (fatty acid hydroxylase superfamily)